MLITSALTFNKNAQRRRDNLKISTSHVADRSDSVLLSSSFAFSPRVNVGSNLIRIFIKNFIISSNENGSSRILNRMCFLPLPRCEKSALEKSFARPLKIKYQLFNQSVLFGYQHYWPTYTCSFILINVIDEIEQKLIIRPFTSFELALTMPSIIVVDAWSEVQPVIVNEGFTFQNVNYIKLRAPANKNNDGVDASRLYCSFSLLSTTT